LRRVLQPLPETFRGAISFAFQCRASRAFVRHSFFIPCAVMFFHLRRNKARLNCAMQYQLNGVGFDNDQ
jgi:hypothetical protein